MAAKWAVESSPMMPRRTWRRYLGVYLLFSVAAHLAWEVAQLPLYTLWQTASAGYLVFAVLHCTGGDLLIAAATFLVALPAAGIGVWPPRRFAVFAATVVVIGVGYTIYSEWLNVFVRQTWAYSEWMPVIPGTGIGLSPVLQWLVIPTLGLIWAYRAVPSRPLSAATAWSPHAGS